MKRHIQIFLVGLAVITVILLLIGCKSKTVYVPVESVKTEYKDRLQRDSIYRYDSVFVKLKGDTVWFEKYKYLYRDKIIKDSVFINDTIRVPYPVDVKGDTIYKMKWYEEIVFYIGLFVLLVIGSYGLFRLIKNRFF